MSPYLCESSQEMFLNYFVASANDITGNAQYHITINKRYFARLSAVCNFKNPFFSYIMCRLHFCILCIQA